MAKLFFYPVSLLKLATMRFQCPKAQVTSNLIKSLRMRFSYVDIPCLPSECAGECGEVNI